MTQTLRFLNQMRKATQALHDELEQTNLLSALLKTTLTEPAYTRALLGLYQAQKPLELGLMSFFTRYPKVVSFEARHLYLCQDIEELTGEGPNKEPDKADIPYITSFAQAAGYLYVLEGSKMGGQFIMTALEKSLPHLGHHFFRSADADQNTLHKLMDAMLLNIQEPEWHESQQAAQAAFQLYCGFPHK